MTKSGGTALLLLSLIWIVAPNTLPELRSVEALDISPVPSLRSRGGLGTTGSRSGAMRLSPARTYSTGSRCAGVGSQIVPVTNQPLPRYRTERIAGNRFRTRLGNRNKEGNDELDDSETSTSTREARTTKETTTARDARTKNPRGQNPISDFLYGANYVHSQYLSIVWRYSVVRSLAVTVPIGIAICLDERYGLYDVLFRGLRSVFFVSSAAARLLQLPLEVAQSLLLGLWEVSPETTAAAIGVLPNAVAIPAVQLGLAAQRALAAVAAIGCESNAATLFSSMLAILVWRPAVEEWQYRSVLDKLLFGPPRWALAWRRKLRADPLEGSSATGRAGRNARSSETPSKMVDTDDGRGATKVSSESDSLRTTEEAAPFVNQSMVEVEVEVEDSATTNRSLVNKLFFGAPRWIRARGRKRELSIPRNVTKDIDPVEDELPLVDETMHSSTKEESSLSTEKATTSLKQSSVTDEINVDAPTEKRSFVDKVLFGAPSRLRNRRRRNELPSLANDTNPEDIIENDGPSSPETMPVTTEAEIVETPKKSIAGDSEDSINCNSDGDSDGGDSGYTPFLPDESTRILLGSLLFATTRLGWLSSDPADPVALSNSPYGFTIGFLQSIFSLLSGGQASAPEVRHGLQIFILLLAIHQTVSTFLVAQHVFAGIYRRRGLAASVGAHVSWTVGKGTIVFRLLWKFWENLTAGIWRNTFGSSPEEEDMATEGTNSASVD